MLFFAAALIAGIVFVSDNFMARVELAVIRVESYAGGLWASRGPAITQDFSAQTQATKTEIGNLYQEASGSVWQNFKSWVSKKLFDLWMGIKD